MKTAFLFPGYGSQYLGMGKELYDNFRIVQELFEEASNCLNVNFVRLCFASSEAELRKLDNAFVAIFLIQASISALLKQEQLQPDIVFGHDIGDYAALHAAGGISVPDALYLLTKYAQFYSQRLSRDAIDALEITGLSQTELDQLCCTVHKDPSNLSIAVCYDQNCLVVTGLSNAIQQLKETIGLQEIDVCHYPLGVGLYSPFMQPVITQLKIYLEKVDIKNVVIPVIGNSDGKLLCSGSEIKQRLFGQLALPLSWNKTMHKLRDVDILIHIGPAQQLAKRISRKYPHKQIVAISRISDIQKLKQYVQSHNQLQSRKNGINHGGL